MYHDPDDENWDFLMEFLGDSDPPEVLVLYKQLYNKYLEWKDDERFQGWDKFMEFEEDEFRDKLARCWAELLSDYVRSQGENLEEYEGQIEKIVEIQCERECNPILNPELFGLEEVPTPEPEPCFVLPKLLGELHD